MAFEIPANGYRYELQDGGALSLRTVANFQLRSDGETYTFSMLTEQEVLIANAREAGGLKGDLLPDEPPRTMDTGEFERLIRDGKLKRVA